MVLLSLVPLLNDPVRLETRHGSFFSFVAVDSSSRVDSRVKNRMAALSREGRALGRPPLPKLLRAVPAAAEEFAARELPGIPADGVGWQDLEISPAELPGGAMVRLGADVDGDGDGADPVGDAGDVRQAVFTHHGLSCGNPGPERPCPTPAQIAMSRTRSPQSLAMSSMSEVNTATGPVWRSAISATVASMAYL